MTTQITVTVRNGTTQHGRPDMLCSPPLWTDIVAFLLVNFVAHAATVVTYPGESTISTIRAIFLALLFPTSGIVRGMGAIVRHAAFVSDPLERAAQAGALCMVVRTKDWLPLDSQHLKEAIWRGKMGKQDVGKFSLFGYQLYRKRKLIFAYENVSSVRTLDLRLYWPPWMLDMSPFWRFLDTAAGWIAEDKNIHGYHVLTSGYALAHVPRDTIILPCTTPRAVEKNCTVSANHSIAKAMVAVIQLCFACITLARSATTEIKDNGYGSYNLTVVQYALMSLLNLIANIVNPAYPALFLVHSEIMDEAISRGSIFDGVVGKMIPHEIEVAGIEGNQINGRIRVVNTTSQRRTKVIPEGWGTMRSSNGEVYFVDLLRKRNTWTDPSVEQIMEINKTTYLFEPEINSSVDNLTHVYTMFRNKSQLARFAEHPPMVDTSAGEHIEYKLRPFHYNPTDAGWSVVDPALFVPICPCFKRKQHHPYSIRHKRAYVNSSGTVRFWMPHNTEDLWWTDIWTMFSCLFLAGITFAIIAAFTKFQKGESSWTTRVVFMTWNFYGMFVGSMVHIFLDRVKISSPILRYLRLSVLTLGLITYCVPVAAGVYYIIVEMQQYGICIKIK